MNRDNTQRLMVILLMAVVAVYTIFNFSQGKINLTYFAVMMAFLLYVLGSNVIRLIRDLRNS